jgi:PAS domain S-box-containing protein
MTPTARQQIRWHRRIEARVVGGVIVLVGLSLTGVLLAATEVATRSAIQRSTVDLEDARSAFYRLVEDRARIAARQTRLIIALPVFRSMMVNPLVAQDVATLTETAENYRKDLGAQFCILTDPKGEPTAMPGWGRDQDMPDALKTAIRGAAAGQSRHDIISTGDSLFLVTSEPAVFADAEILGTVTFGFALDDRVADELAQVTHAEVNLISNTTLVGSSLPADEKNEIGEYFSGAQQSNGIASEIRHVGHRRFVRGTFPLFRDRGSDDIGHLVLMQDWAPTQRFLDELQGSLVLAGIVAFGLSLGGGLIFSRRTSQPIMDMADAAKDIAEGDWDRQVPVRGSAEATIMATAFNEMTSSLRDHADRLKSAYHRFSTVTQSARDAIISIDAQGRVNFWNRSAEATFGYAESEIIGEPIIRLIAESDRESYKNALPTPGAADTKPGHVLEVTGIRKDQTMFPCEFSLAPLQGPEGTAFTAVVRDVTERKQAQEALRQRDEQLRQAQKMEAIGRLAGGVAHDFNNLLMAIQGYGEVLVQSLPATDERKSDAEEIVKAAERAAGLTRQLLAFSRRQVITQQALSLDQIVQSTQKMLQRLIGENVELKTEIWPDLSLVLADRTQVEQILMNLVVNARDAMPGGGQITISLRNIELDKLGVAAHPGLQPGDYVELAVGDTGSGIDPDTMSRIFEPFFTTKEGTKGTGLGLATVYGIVQQSNGAIEVQSTVGHGTTFLIYLPRATDYGKPAPPKPAATVTGPATILLVEDDDRVRALVSNMLKQNGYTVMLASQGDQALEIAARHHGRIHLLLTDVIMPGISGRVLAERLTVTRPDTRVLYMSGYSDDAILRHGVKSAGTHFLQKPFSHETLIEKVREALSAVART